jgi:hypothetical protein
MVGTSIARGLLRDDASEESRQCCGHEVDPTEISFAWLHLGADLGL